MFAHLLRTIALAALLTGLSGTALANDVIKVRRMGGDLAADIAKAAVHACREKGYQASAVVVDRTGNLQAALRDSLASRFTLEIAERKANAVILAGSDSGELRKSRGDIRPELNHIGGLIIMEGGLQIRAAGSLIGAVGVSGAPGGDIDAECAQAALDVIQEKLDFAD